MKSKTSFRLVTEYPVTVYKCGLKAGDIIRLKHEIRIKDHEDRPTGQVYVLGDTWTVIPGAKEDPQALWLKKSDGKRCTWSDDETVFETFEKL